MEKKQKAILEQLDKVEQPYKLILEKVYIKGKSLVTVASELGYSYVHICREHGIALNKFDRISDAEVMTSQEVCSSMIKTIGEKNIINAIKKGI